MLLQKNGYGKRAQQLCCYKTTVVVFKRSMVLPLRWWTAGLV
jgi:hypothetical protein